MRDGDTNIAETWCRRCRGLIAPGEGEVRKRAMVHREECPEPDDIIRPNRYAGQCNLCEGWVPAGEGVAVRQDSATITGARYSAQHDGYCPADPAPAPVRGGVAAQWTAPHFGRMDKYSRPWVRELYLDSRDGTQQRRWVRGVTDYSEATEDGTHGITSCFTLRAGKLYEAECAVEKPHAGGFTRARTRMYLRVTEDGDVQMLNENAEEVRAWLSAG